MLELRRASSWTAVAQSDSKVHGAFVLRWHVSRHLQTGPVRLRVVALGHRRTLAATRSVASWIGPAYVACAPAAPPAVDIPVGDGWIVGGLYIEGGPYPGLDQCQSSPYTIEARAPDGSLTTTQSVAGGHSFTLVVPAGSYTLRATSGCPGTSAPVSVTAGRQANADTICAVP